MSKQEQEHLRKQLECKLEELSALPATRTDLIIVPVTDPMDRAQSRISMDLAVHAINDGWQISKAVRSALQRIDRGEYGICETCGETIRHNRLRAIPWATLCTACQSSKEIAEEPTHPLRDVA